MVHTFKYKTVAFPLCAEALQESDLGKALSGGCQLIGALLGGSGGELDPVLTHFPHSGTQQMNGLVTPPLLDPALQAAQYQQSVPFQPDAMPPLPTEPMQAMGNVITSGFEAQQAARRSGSGSQVWRCGQIVHETCTLQQERGAFASFNPAMARCCVCHHTAVHCSRFPCRDECTF